MSVIHRCDKCGKESDAKSNTGFSSVTREHSGPTRLGDRNPDSFLLCLDCVYELWHEIIPKWAKGEL